MLKLYQCRQDSASNAPPAGIVRRRRGIGIIAGLLMAIAASAASASTPYLGSPFSEPGTQINAVDFDAGSSGDAYYVANPVSPASTSYRNTPVPLFATSDPGRGYAVDHNIVPGDFFAFTTNFTTGGSFDIAIRAATANQDGTGASGRFVHIEVDGVNVTGSINLAPTSSWTSFATTSISSVAIPAGAHKLKFVVESPVGQFGFNWIQITQHQTFTYYVSPSGNDGNDGKSTSTPWRTLAKVNGAALGPGDTVLFQRGGEWHEVLNPLVDGRASNPITFADYGSGNKPKFWGSDFMPVNDSGWVPQGGNVYTHAWSQQVNSVLANHQFLIDIFNGGTGDGSVVRDPSSTANCWKWSGGTLTISTNGSDPRTNGVQYDLCVRDNVVCNGNQLTSNYHSHLVFRNIVVDECGSNQNPTLGYGIRVEGDGVNTGIDVLVDGCEVYRYGRHGFAVIDGSQVTFNNCYCAYPMPNVQTGQTGYVSFGNQGPNLSETSVYNNCVAEHQADTWNGRGDFEYEAFTDHGNSLASVTLNNFQAIDSGGDGAGDNCTFDGASGAVVTVNGGVCYSSQVNTLGPNVTVNGMRITGPYASMDIAGNGNVIENCLIAGTNNAAPYNSAIWIRGDSNIFRFNTVATASNAGNGFTALCLASLGSTYGTNAQVYGNVLYANQLAINTFTSSNTFNAAMVKDNLYNNGATFQINYGTVWNLSQWQAQGYDAGSIQTATPGFSNPAAYDYSLTSSSPAINAAPIGTTTPAMPGTDILGNPRKVGANYDIGAYEYQTGGTTSPPVISSAATATGTVGMAFSYTITASNSPTSFSATGLPAGLSVNTSTGVISGTPTASGTSTVTLGATNSGGTGSKTLTITISAAAAEAPYGGTPWAITGTVQAENYDTGGAGVAYQDSDAGNTGGAYRSDDVDIRAVLSDAGGGYQVGWTNAGEYLKYTVNVTAAGTYALNARVASGASGGSVHFNVDGVNKTGTLTFGSTGGWDTFITVTSGSFTLTSGQHIIQLVEETGGYDINWFSVTTTEGPYGGTAWPIPGKIEAENYDTGGEGVAYHDNDAGNTGGAYRSDNVDIRAVTSDAGGGYQVGWTNSGEYLKYTVNVTTAGSYVFNARVASGASGGSFHFNVDGTNATGALTFAGTGSYDTFTTVSSGNVTLTAGQHIIQLYEDTDSFDINWFSVTSAATPFNVNAYFSLGTTVTNGGADSYGNAYESNLLPASATYNGSTFTFGPANALDAWANTTVNLPAGTYTTLNMLATAVGGNRQGDTFVVHYTDGSTQSFSQNLSDWVNPQGFAGETNAVTMANRLATNGTTETPAAYIYGYTFTLNGKSVQSITLPATRLVVAFGFAGR